MVKVRPAAQAPCREHDVGRKHYCGGDPTNGLYGKPHHCSIPRTDASTVLAKL
jgi:hypothetical protein